MNDVLTKLDKVLESRKHADPATSYAARLFGEGLERILSKVDEESQEVIKAARQETEDHVVAEVADLWFHTLVLLHQQNRSGQDVLNTLDNRFGISGIEEKASRQTDVNKQESTD